jgi:hypothetical protein
MVGAAIAGFGYRYVVGDTGAEPLAAEAQDISEAEVAIGELSVAAAPAPASASYTPGTHRSTDR